jgi:hypothetical protein
MPPYRQLQFFHNDFTREARVFIGANPRYTPRWQAGAKVLLAVAIAAIRAGELLEKPHRDKLRLRVMITNIKNPMLGDLAKQGPQWWYDNMPFGPGFKSALTKNYRLVLVIDNDWIYLSEPDAPHDGGAKRAVP